MKINKLMESKDQKHKTNQNQINQKQQSKSYKTLKRYELWWKKSQNLLQAGITLAYLSTLIAIMS